MKIEEKMKKEGGQEGETKKEEALSREEMVEVERKVWEWAEQEDQK